MAFIDELKFHMKAGNGGNGVERWLHEKGKEYSGPAGGNGGRGGSLYARAVRDLNILSSYKNTKDFSAENGENGMKKSMKGKDGEDLFIDFPIGSVITNLETGQKFSLEKEGQEELLLKGGNGGLGNEHFKASTNVRPKEHTDGKEGEEGNFLVELELFADIGLIGLPNAGKSSLLNAITNTSAKVGSYAFTTLEPNLGDFYGYVIADIPGLIEGAAEGKGLGIKFLRHVKRTRIILHCVSLESENILESYKTVRDELEKYSQELSTKDEIVILTKKDEVTEEDLDEKLSSIKKLNKNCITVSVLDENSVKELKDYLVKLLRK